MELIRAWIVSVTVSAIVIAAADALMPEGAVRQVGRFTGGLILLLGLLQPVVNMDYGDLYAMVNALPVDAVRQEAAEEALTAPMKTGIEDRLAAYIVEEAAALGAVCTAEVRCTPDENGVPIPAEAVVSGRLTPDQRAALSAGLSEALGLAPDRQTFLCEETS